MNLLQNKQSDNARTVLQNIQLTVSYDMGWQKRAGGRVYDSLSGHAYMIGCLSGKVVQMGVLCKKCKTCSNFNRKDMEPPIHPCPVNHEASSGAMEARCCCTLLEEVCRKFDGIVTVGCLVTDDDSTLRSHCKTSGEGGKLAETTPTPRFLTDPGHRIKVIGKALFGLVTKTKNIDEVRTVDVLRLKKYFSFYISQNKHKSFDEFKRNIRSPIEHLFGDHTYCDSSWCWAKDYDDFVHKSIIDKMEKHSNQTNNDEITVTNNIRESMSVAGDSTYDAVGSAMVDEAKDDDYAEDIDLQWAEALNVDAMIDTTDWMDSDDGSKDEWSPDTVRSDEESSVDDDDEVVGSIDDLVMEELKYEAAICEDLENYGIEQTVFNESELNDIRRKERILMERGDKGYYRCKSIHKTAYAKITQALEKYMTEENLRMIHHPFTTQSNEALNKSVSAYAPKHKTYSLTKSLEARVSIAGATQIQGYRSTWNHLYDHFQLTFDSTFENSLSNLDATKKRNRDRAASKEGKLRRTAAKIQKLNKVHKQDMEDQKKGLVYQAGIAINDAKKKQKQK